MKEKVILDNKEKEINKILLVSDIFFCLFDQEKWTKNNLQLTFWSNIRSLVTVKKMIKGDTCRFFWKQKSKKKPYEMIITIENSNDLVNLLLDKMSKFGINYKVTKQNTGPKQGVIPSIDIDNVEKNILEVEAKVEIKPDMEMMHYLMSLYDQAVEYYSATNNPKWEHYTEKIHATLKSPRIKDFLDKDNVEGNKTMNNNVESKEQNKQSEDNLENEPNSTFIPKEKRIVHIETANTLEPEPESKILQEKEEDNSKADKEKPIEEDKLISNEKTGIKLEIAQDENEEHFDYSDDDYDEEEN